MTGNFGFSECEDILKRHKPGRVIQWQARKVFCHIHVCIYTCAPMNRKTKILILYNTLDLFNF